MGSITSDSLPKAGRVRRQVVTPPVESPPVETADELSDEDLQATDDESKRIDEDPEQDEEVVEDEDADPVPPPPTRVVHQAGKPAMGRRARSTVAETTTPVASPSDNSVAKTSFRVMLREAARYEFQGMHFRKGVPAEVPIKYYKIFKSNGFFTVLD